MRVVFFLLLMTGIYPVQANELLIRPQTSGGWKVTQSGASAGMAPNILSYRQPSGTKLVVQVVAEGYGSCQGGKINGSGELASLNISLTAVATAAGHADEAISCGESVNFGRSDRLQHGGIRIDVATMIPEFTKNIPQNLLGKKILLGTVSFMGENNDFQFHAVYLDLTMFRDSVPELKASFNRSTLLLGEINAFRDAREMLTLNVSKTQSATNVPLPYTLKFDSGQMRDNSFQLKSSQGDIFVPYKVFIDNVNISPSDEYRGIVPAGTATSDIVQISFLLASAQVSGIPAGTKLTDVLTAVIIPDS